MPDCYLHHPQEIPIAISPHLSGICEQSALCRGGLRCSYDRYFAPRTSVSLVVNLTGQSITAHGWILLCQRINQQFLLSIGFSNPQTLFKVRMIEQACEIECYRRRQQRDGRMLTAAQAASEWIAKHAASFPALSRLQ